MRAAGEARLDRVERLLHARSLAVVGASERPDSFGRFLVEGIRDGGYTGTIYPVNPAYTALLGLPCYPTVAALPQPPDCALLAVSNARLEAALAEVAAAGIPAAVIFGSAHGPAADGVTPLSTRLASIAAEGGVALCGGNAMGFLTFRDRLFATGFPYRGNPIPGHVAFISHSGSTFSAVANNRRGLRFSHVISSGQEIGLTAADYLHYLVLQPETRAVGLFLEGVRDPEAFIAALEAANARDLPVVVLKVGRSERGRVLAAAHSGAIAGEDAAYDALFARYGVSRVRTLDELLDTLELLSAPRRPATGGLAVATDSGGERGLIVDLAADLGLSWAELAPATTATLRANLDPELEPVNPLDLWGSGHEFERRYESCLTALAADPAVGLLLFAIDLTPRSRLLEPYLGVAERVAATVTTPFAVLANLAATADEAAQTRLRAAGIPVLLGTENGLAAAAHLLRRAGRSTAPPPDQLPEGPGTDVIARWATRLAATGDAWDEIESKRLLADWGIPVIAEREAGSAAGAVAAAAALGFPVVLKMATPGVTHKSEHGGVILGLRDETEVAAAYRRLARAGSERVVVQAQAPADGSIELLVGMVRDPQWGPLVTLGLGGIFVEILGDVVTFLPPVTPGQALDQLGRLRAIPLLRGARGRPPVALAAVADSVARFSLLCRDLGDALAAIDVNPLIAGSWGAVAVDALVIPRESRIERSEPDPIARGETS